MTGTLFETLFEQRAEITCELRDEAGEERLWAVCEQLVGELVSMR